MKLLDRDDRLMTEQYTDEQHIDLHREGEPGHKEALTKKYEHMVHAKAGTMFIIGGDHQDLFQEGMIGLLKAIEDYDSGRDASFATFADLCVARQMYKAIQSSGRLKNLPLNDYISLYSGKESDEEDALPIVETLAAAPQTEPERKVLDDVAADEIMKIIDTQLTERERDAFLLNVAGIPTSEIAAILSIEGKSADNALQRAKGKLRKALSQE